MAGLDRGVPIGVRETLKPGNVGREYLARSFNDLVLIKHMFWDGGGDRRDMGLRVHHVPRGFVSARSRSAR